MGGTSFEEVLKEAMDFADEHHQWISIEEGVPEETFMGLSDDVIVFTKSRRYIEAQFNHTSNCWWGDCSDDEVTHWMYIKPPIPNPNSGYNEKKGGEE